MNEIINDKCDKCSPEDHEGNFCRCEIRNIKLAKQKRKEGLSPWNGVETPKDIFDYYDKKLRSKYVGNGKIRMPKDKENV